MGRAWLSSIKPETFIFFQVRYGVDAQKCELLNTDGTTHWMERNFLLAKTSSGNSCLRNASNHVKPHSLPLIHRPTDHVEMVTMQNNSPTGASRRVQGGFPTVGMDKEAFVKITLTITLPLLMNPIMKQSEMILAIKTDWADENRSICSDALMRQRSMSQSSHEENVSDGPPVQLNKSRSTPSWEPANRTNQKTRN